MTLYRSTDSDRRKAIGHNVVHSIAWLIDWFVDWFTRYSLIGPLIDWLIDVMDNFVAEYRLSELPPLLNSPKNYWSIRCLFTRFEIRISWMTDFLFDEKPVIYCSIDWLIESWCTLSRLVDCLIDWLIDEFFWVSKPRNLILENSKSTRNVLKWIQKYKNKILPR